MHHIFHFKAFLHKLILVWAHLNTCICIYFSSLLFFFPYSLRQGFNFSKSNFWSKQWKEPGDNRNDKGCQVVVKLEKSKFVSGLSKINESKLHLINHRQKWFLRGSICSFRLFIKNINPIICTVKQLTFQFITMQLIGVCAWCKLKGPDMK